MLMAVVDQYSAMSDLGAALEGQLTGDYQEDLLRIGTLFLEMMNRHRRAVLMTICEAQHSSEVREVIARPPLLQRKMLGHYLREQMERGVVRDLPDPELAAQAFFAMLFEYSISQSLYADPSAPSLLPEEVVAQVIDIFARGTVKED